MLIIFSSFFSTLERHIEKEEARARLSELNSNDKSYVGINGELLLIYFLLFVLMLTISCFVLGVFLRKRRLGNSDQNSNPNNLHNANTNDKTAIHDKTRYIKVPTNNNDLTNLNLNN